MNLVALPTVAILVKKAIAICPDAKINLLTEIFNRSDAQLLETLRVACFHEVVRRRCDSEQFDKAHCKTCRTAQGNIYGGKLRS
ncbi:MAG: hypothetical protein ACYTX0_51640 [Nostoc sp.]